MKENRIFGPPGTGKTTELSRWLQAAAMRLGKIIAASFSKTAAVELASRNKNLRDYVGTLHSWGYRSLGSPAMVNSDDFNEFAPRYKLSKSRQSNDDLGIDSPHDTDGDELRVAYNMLRNKMVEPDLWPPNVKGFATEWEKFKHETDTIDFCDQIELAYLNVDKAPNDPVIGLFDEVQDNSKLEVSLIRKWGQHMEQVVLAGDPDQCVYSFKGASPDSMTQGDADWEKVLSQSYRIPSTVHEYSQKLITTIKGRKVQEYHPKVDEVTKQVIQGYMNRSPAMMITPEKIVEEACKNADNGETSMILGSCAYHLNNTIAFMKKEGIAFHNPFRPAFGEWNPLSSRGKSSTVRMLAYLEPSGGHDDEGWPRFTWGDLDYWLPLVSAKQILVRGAKAEVGRVPEEDYNRALDPRDMRAIFKAECFEETSEFGNIAWLKQHFTAKAQNSLTFPLKIYDRGELPALKAEPKITVGTIHSVKGGEADHVYVFPDMSPSMMLDYTGRPEQRATLTRLFYVAVTRAKRGLTICSPCNGRFYPL